MSIRIDCVLVLPLMRAITVVELISFRTTKKVMNTLFFGVGYFFFFLEVVFDEKLKKIILNIT